jgi:hypothetical protein
MMGENYRIMLCICQQEEEEEEEEEGDHVGP